MEQITFDNLPEMVSLILEKVTRLEQIICNSEKAAYNSDKVMLTTDEAADFMGFSKSKLYKMSLNREIPIYKPTGGRIYFKKDDILNYLQRNRVMSNEEIEQEAINYVVNSKSKRR